MIGSEIDTVIGIRIGIVTVIDVVIGIEFAVGVGVRVRVRNGIRDGGDSVCGVCGVYRVGGVDRTGL